MVEPELRTMISIAPLPCARISIVDVGGEYFTALSSSCRSARPSSSRSASTVRSSGTCFDEMVAIETRLELPQRRGHDVGEIVTIEMHGKVAGIDAQHLHRVGHERLKAIEVFVDDGDQLAIAGAGRRAGQQIARRRLHRRERRLELVRQRVQHRRPQLAALVRRLGARRRFLRPGPLEPDRRQVRDRLQHGVAEPAPSMIARLPMGAPPS